MPSTSSGTAPRRRGRARTSPWPPKARSSPSSLTIGGWTSPASWATTSAARSPSGPTCWKARDFRAIALIDAVALSPWGSSFYRLVQDHVGVFRRLPAYIHEAIVAAYVRDATYVPMDDATLKPYIEPWLGAEGQEAFYRQIYQNDPRYTDEVQPLYARIERPVLIVWGEEDRWIPQEGRTAAQSHTWLAIEDDTPLRPPRPGGRPRGRGRVPNGLLRPLGACPGGATMQDLGYEFPRKSIPRTPVNKGKTKGRGTLTEASA